MFDSLHTPFPTGQLTRRSRAMPELSHRPSTGNVDVQLQKLRISAIAVTKMGRAGENKRRTLPKRISLPENLEFQPQKLLTMKQSMHIEKRISGEPLRDAFRMQRRLSKHARIQLMRQQSYQQAQKQSVLPLPVESLTPLSPIEDLPTPWNASQEEAMETS